MRNNLKIFLSLLLTLLIFISITGCAEKDSTSPIEGQSELLDLDYNAPYEGELVIPEESYRAIAYVTVPASENWRWIGTDDGENVISGVDTNYVTHINFAFGMIKAYQFDPQKPGRPLMRDDVASKEAYKDPSDGEYHYKVTLDGWIEEMDAEVSGGKYLKALVNLKKQKPALKVLLSVGGWDSDGFCYMARTEEGRTEFIQSLVDIIKEYNLDGIDLDWEYPTNGGWGAIAHCNSCQYDARRLLSETRKAFDEEFQNDHKLLTVAQGVSAGWLWQNHHENEDGEIISGDEVFDMIDYMNVMCYDYNPGSGGDMAGLSTGSSAMNRYANAVGDTPKNRLKINMGVPFYNEGGPYLVPYHKGYTGHIDASAELIEEKMEWVKSNGFGGGFYWAYSMDVFSEDNKSPEETKILQRTLWNSLYDED